MSGRHILTNLFFLVISVVAASAASAATVILFDQDYESPTGYVNDGQDLNAYRTVNQNYGNQPAGFQYAQTFTVETLNITGSQRGAGTAAWGTGWSDPSGIGGNFAIGMLSTVENDLLGLSFNVGALPFLNFTIDVSSIDLQIWGGPFVATGAVPRFRFTLFDNPGGTANTGSGNALDQAELTGAASAQTVFDWTNGVFGLSTAGNTNGNVTLQIDLLEGGYAAFDNLRITASDTKGDVGGGTPVIPLPASFVLLASALGILGLGRLRAA